MKRFLFLSLLSLLIAPLVYGKSREAKPGSGAPTDSKPRGDARPSGPPELVLGTVAHWQAEAELRHPDLRSPGSVFSCAFRTALEAMRHDDPRFFAANDWPLRLAERVARSFGDANPPHGT